MLLAARLLGERALRAARSSRQLATRAVSATRRRPRPTPTCHELIDDATHCPAYFQMLIKSLPLPGLMELAETSARRPTW